MMELPGYIRFSIVSFGIALVIVAMILAQYLLIPLVWALLLTVMVLPVAQWLEKRVKRRAIASVLSIVMLIIVGGGILALLTSQAIGLANDTPMIASKFADSIADLRHFADEHLGLPFFDQPEMFKDQLSSAAEGLMSRVSNTLQHTLTTITQLVVVPIYVFFLLTYRERFTNFVVQLTLAKDKTHTLHTMTKASQIVQGYLRGASIEVVIVGIMVLILFLVLGIKHALFFAVLVALLNVIPYIGVFIGSTLSVIYAFFTTDNWVIPVLVFVFLWVIQIIDNNFVVPFVVGQQIRLNPLAILLVVVLGGLIWGVSGMIIFIPVLGMVKVVFDESVSLKPYGYLLGDR